MPPSAAGCDLLDVVCNPTWPDAPFSTPLIAAADTVRVAVIACAVLGVLVTPALSWRALDRFQWHRFLAVALFQLSAADTEYTHLGDIPSLRLLLLAAAVGLSLSGYWGIRPRHDGTSSPSLKPAPRRWRHPRRR